MERSERIFPAAMLQRYGAAIVPVGKGETVVREGEHARFFFVVKRGKVRMTNTSAEGKEFTQGYFGPGESFGEPPFFGEAPYPASAVATTDSEVWKIGKPQFLRLLREHPEVHLALTQSLCSRLIYKSMMLSEIAIEEAEHRVRTILRHLQKESGTDPGKTFLVPFSRQQLADLCGLRVETVIRTVKALERKGEVGITRDGKIRLG